MAQRGRPKKIQTTLISEEKNMNSVIELPGIHVIVRFLSRSNRSDARTGEISGQDFDELLNSWYKDGYRVASSHFIGDSPEGHGLMIILQKE